MKKYLGIFMIAFFGAVAGAWAYKTLFGSTSITSKTNLPSVFSKFDPSGTNDLPNFVGSAEAVRPAVVHIRSKFKGSGQQQDFLKLFDPNMQDVPEGMASGSGVIIAANGYIATNNHVVENASSIEVVLTDNRSFEAEVIGTDPNTDLALLKVDAEDLPFVQMGNSDAVKVGEWVLAIGNPMDLTSTVTAGIVSAKGRNINLLEKKFAIESFIQTDAVVNRGNSGGALVNVKGELVGINTAIASRTGYYAGYSFAVPSAIVQKVMEDLKEFGEVRRGILGVSIASVNAEIAKINDLSTLTGAFISGVNAGSGAEDAGIKQGDVITEVEGVNILGTPELQEAIARHRPGDMVKIKVLRGDDEKEFSVKLMNVGNGSVASSSSAKSTEGNKNLSEMVGSKFRLLSGDEKSDLEVESGVKVEKVGPKLAIGGIRPGFIITKVNGKRMNSLAMLEEEFRNTDGMIKIEGLYEKGSVATYNFTW